MKVKYSNLFLWLGVTCFLLGAIALLLRRLETPLNVVLPAMGLILVGIGAAGKRRSMKERK